MSVCLSVCHRTTSQRKEMTTRKWYRSKRNLSTRVSI